MRAGAAAVEDDIRVRLMTMMKMPVKSPRARSKRHLPKCVVRVYLLVRDEDAARPPVDEASGPPHDCVAFFWLTKRRKVSTGAQ